MAINWDEMYSSAKKKDEKQYQQMVADTKKRAADSAGLITWYEEISPVRTYKPNTSTVKPTVTTTKNSFFSDGYQFGDVTRTVVSKSLSAIKNNFSDGYDFGDVTKTILGVSSAPKVKSTVSAFDSSLMNKYSSMNLSQIENEYKRVTAELDSFKKANGGKFYNFIAKTGASVGVSSDQTGTALSEFGKADANISKINDLTREKEIISLYRKQIAIKEKLGEMSDEQLQLLDNIAEAESIDDAAPFFYMSADAKYSDPSSYYKMTDSERQLGESSKKKLFEQLKGENPGKSDEELNELIDELVELRSNQRNAEQQASESAQIGELATEHPVAAFLLSRGADLAGGMVALPELFFQRGNEYGFDINAPGFSFVNASAKIDEQIQLDHDWKIGGVDAFDLFYEAGTGIVDNVARLAFSGGNTAAAGAVMFSQVATQSIVEGKKKGYSDSKALASGLLVGTFEAVSEKLSLDAVLGSKGGVLKRLAKAFAAEGGEEVTSNWLNRVADVVANGNHSELLRKYEAYREMGYSKSKALAETVLDAIGEDAKSFVVGGIAGTVMGGGNIALNAVSNVMQKNEPVQLDEKSQTVVDKVVEALVEQEKQKGNKVSKSTEKNIRKAVINNLNKGYLDKDSIYREFGGEEYENYKKVKELSESNISSGKQVIKNLENAKKKLQKEYDALYKMKNGDKSDEQIDRQNQIKEQIANIDAEIEKTTGVIDKLSNDKKLSDLEAKLDANVYELVKDSKLAETFREGDRRGERFSADTGQYKDEYAKKTVQNAIDYGVNTEYGFNNTNAAHDFVDFAVKIASDKKVEIVFTNTEGLTKLKEGDNEYNITADPNKINAFISEEHNKMFINMDTNKSLQSLVGHEITHTTEKAKSYNNVADLVRSILGEEEFNSLVEKKTETYKKLNLSKEDIEKEVVADFIGDRLFTDYDFIKRLSVEHRNIFQQIWDEIKYLCKVATTGSKELRELEKLKHQFEKAYKESAKEQKNTANDGSVIYSIKNTSEMTLKEQLNLLYKNKLKSSDSLYLGMTPRSILTSGLDELPLAFPVTNYEKSRIEKHNVPRRSIKSLNENLEKALFSFGTDNKIGFVLPDIDADGKPLLVGIEKGVFMDRKPTNVIRSIYGLDNPAEWIENHIKNGETFVLYNEKEANSFLQTYGYSASVEEGIRLLNNILPQNTEKSSGNVDYSLNEQEVQAVNTKLNEVGYSLDAKSGTVSYSLNSLEEAFSYKTDKNGVLLTENDYLKARNEYVNALANSIAAEKGKPTREEYKKADRYLDSLFLIHDLIASDRDRLDYEAAPGRKAWVGNTEYGGSIDFSTLCAKRRIFTGTFDAIQNALPDTVLTDKDFLNIRKLLLEYGEESPCSMCYVEGSRAKHGQYVDKWLKEYLKTNPEWKPQIADFTSTVRLEQTRIQHPEAYAAYVQAMNKLSQRKPKEASVRTDYKGEILDVFENGESVEQKNLNGGIRFNSFSDFEIIHALDCMQVLTDMSRVGLNGQAYTKVKEFAEAFGNTGLKINLSLVAKDVDANGKLVMDEVNGMNYAEAKDIRSRYSDNVGTVIVVFNDEQLKAALSDDTIDFVLPFHRSQWKKSQYALMGLPNVTRDYTNIQNDRYKNPKTGRAKKVPDGNIMPNEYWDFNLSGRENAQRYLDYINENSYIPKFDFLLNKVDGKWVLPDDAVGDGYFKLLIDFKMYNNEGVGSPQNPVLPEFNMPYIQQMLENYKGGHQAFPVANDVVDEFVEGKKSGRYSLSDEGETFEEFGNFNTYAKDITLQGGIAPRNVSTSSATDDIAPVRISASPGVKPVGKADIAKVKEKRNEYYLGQELIGTKSPDKKAGGIWSDFVRNFVSKGAVFETTALKTKNRALEDKYKMWKDRSEAKAQYFMENGNEDVPSLKSIVEKAQKAGLYDKFDLYLAHRHNMSRMLYDKPIFGSGVTGEMSLQTVAELQKKHPEFKEWAKDVYRYNDYLLNKTVEGGIISREFADELLIKYPNYVPIERLGKQIPLTDSDRASVNNPVKTATGGNQPFESPLKAMAHRTTQVFKAVDKNAFGVELMKTLGSDYNFEGMNVDDILDKLNEMDESLIQPGKDGKNPTFTVFENGERLTFEISEEMYKALQPTTEAMSREHKLFSVPSKLHKKVLTEYSLFFTARNFPKDIQEVIINSKHPAKTYANMPVAVKELLKGEGKYVTEYWKNGGKSNTYFEGKENDFIKDDGAVKKVIGFLPNGISKVNDFVEAIPRLAEYIASRKNGATIEGAMLDAARVTTDFSDGGDITKFANRNGFTFLNASVQGASQQVRNIRQAKAEGFKGIAKLVGKYAISGLPVLLFNHLMWDDDEEYEELSEYVKDNYYVIAKYGDGQFVRIPKGRTAAVLQEVAEQAYGILTGEVTGWDGAKDSGLAIYESFMNNIAPSNPIENNVIAPIMQAASNKTWYGEDLVPTRLQDVPAREQFDETTDSISKWLGENTGISPYKINYLLNQYSGFIGDIVLPGLTPEAERGDTSALGNLLAPLKDQFVVDGTIKNRNPSDFYGLSDELEVKANSKDATDEDKLKQKYISSISYEMGDLYKQKREIQNSNLSDELKYKQVRDIQAQINEIAKNALENYENVKIEKNYATVGGVQYRFDENKGLWQKLYDDEVEKMNDATKILGISPGEYWSNKDEYNMKAFYPEKYEVLQQEGISVKEYKEKYEERAIFYNDDFSWASNNPEKYTLSKAITDNVVDYRKITKELYAIRADKDENGKAINGSAKEKKQKFIWNLDIDDGAKYILFKNEYNSCDDYNYEIIDYLNNRDDISFDEMKTILTSIGFEVDGEGNISWD